MCPLGDRSKQPAPPPPQTMRCAAILLPSVYTNPHDGYIPSLRHLVYKTQKQKDIIKTHRESAWHTCPLLSSMHALRRHLVPIHTTAKYSFRHLVYITRKQNDIIKTHRGVPGIRVLSSNDALRPPPSCIPIPTTAIPSLRHLVYTTRKQKDII